MMKLIAVAAGVLLTEAAVAQAPSAVDAAAIRRYLTTIYTSYRENGTPASWANAFTPATRRLIDVNIRLNNGEAGAASGADPICGCQDYGTIRVTGMTFAWRPDGRVTTRVRFMNFGPQNRTLVMERTPAGWRVHDVFDANVSYRTSIAEENADLSRARR